MGELFAELDGLVAQLDGSVHVSREQQHEREVGEAHHARIEVEDQTVLPMRVTIIKREAALQAPACGTEITEVVFADPPSHVCFQEELEVAVTFTERTDA